MRKLKKTRVNRRGERRENEVEKKKNYEERREIKKENSSKFQIILVFKGLPLPDI